MHNQMQQIQQIQQRINNVTQMAGQIRQAEENTRQKLLQMAHEEGYVAQQLLRVQQLCQESLSSLQSISVGTVGTVGQQTYQGISPTPTYTQGFSSQISSPQFHNQSDLFNLATMNPDTYQNSMQFLSGQGGNFGVGQGVLGQTSIPGVQTGYSGQTTGVGQMMSTQTPLSGISTMGPDVYQSSREQLGKGSSSLSQIGQEAGISSQITSGGQQPGFTGMIRSYN